MPLDNESCHISALAHSIEHDGCAAATTAGMLLFFGAASGALHELGRLHAAVLAMQWNPDGDTLALATADGVSWQTCLLSFCTCVFLPSLRHVPRCAPRCGLDVMALHAGKLLLMTDLREVAAEVSLQQSLTSNGAAVVDSETDSFAPASVSLSWRGDGAFLATVSRASDECAPFHPAAAVLRVTVPRCLGEYPCVQARSNTAHLEPGRLHARPRWRQRR